MRKKLINSHSDFAFPLLSKIRKFSQGRAKEKKTPSNFEDFVLDQIQFILRMYCKADSSIFLKEQILWKSMKSTMNQFEDSYFRK